MASRGFGGSGTPKVIALTGVTRGLGRALALAWLDAGHTVAGCGRSREGLAGLAQEARTRGGRLLLARVDVALPHEVFAWARAIIADVGPPDLLVQNAALVNRNARLWELDPAETGRVIDVNVKGVLHGIHAFVPAMAARGSGVIVNLSSGWGRSTAPEVAPYCASKWAIEGLSQSLAQELPPGLACVALNPGIIDTDMLRSAFGPSAAAYEQPESWAQRAAPYILGLDRKDNGKPLSVP